MPLETPGDQIEALLTTNPQKALELLQKVGKSVITPHSGGQREVFEAQQRFQIVCAGRRWGKTKVAVKKALRECRKQEKIVWWVAPTYKVVRRAYRETLKQIPPGVLSKPAPPPTADGRLLLHFKTGSRMEFYSAENPESMVGEGVDYVVVDEAAVMNERVWLQIIRPTLMDTKGSALLISTPRGLNWFYDVWVRGQDEEFPDYASWKFPTAASPYIDDAEIEEAEKTLPAVVYEQEILAEFVSNAAAVFRFDEGEAVKNPIGVVKDMHIVMGIDLAKHRDFTVLTASDSTTRRAVYHDRFNAVSWPQQRRRIRAAVKKLEDEGATVTCVVDSTGIGDVIFDDMEEEGFDVIPVKFTPQWKQMAVYLLSADLERGGAFILPNQVNEFRQYRYEVSETSGRMKFGAPEGAHDDEVSAKMLEHWGIVHFGVPSVQLFEAPIQESPMDGGKSEYDQDYFDMTDEGEATEFTLEPPHMDEIFARDNTARRF